MRWQPFPPMLVLFVVAILGACRVSTDPDSGAECRAGDHLVCWCPDGTPSSTPCVGGTLAPCPCDPVSGGAGEEDSGQPDGGGDAGELDGGDGADAGDGGRRRTDAGFGEYMGPCDETADCAPDLFCFNFERKGRYCTKSCEDSAECPPPSPKCNPRKVCAVPD